MLNYNSLGSAPNSIDPNSQRALETLFTLISDVEQRLQIVKASISQTLPTFGNVNLNSPHTLGLPTTNPTTLLGHVGAPATWPAIVATPFGNVSVLVPLPTTPTTTPFGNAGFATPFGTPFATPFGTPQVATPFGLTPSAFGNFRI